MFFSEENLEKLADEYSTINEKHDDLIGRYFLHKFENDRAREFAHQGLNRRLVTLKQCIHNIFAAIPPERDEIPSREERSAATINIQAFVFNAFGCLDNLAWIWVKETDLTMENGSDLPNGYVGLREKNKLVRASFSPEFREYLKSRDKWIGNLEDFRHALAHRIPLYIPPHCVLEDNQGAYEDLEQKISQCVDVDERRRLESQKMELCEFRPIMLHSFEEKSNRVVFHAQVIADFNTIIELGQKFLEELEIHREAG